MPNYRRAYQPGGTFFFTLVTYRRARFLCDPLARRLLHEAVNACRAEWPFGIDAGDRHRMLGQMKAEMALT